jgi:hypothetical protein
MENNGFVWKHCQGVWRTLQERIEHYAHLACRVYQSSPHQPQIERELLVEGLHQTAQTLEQAARELARAAYEAGRQSRG